jgi:hypothetical protein
MKIKPIAVFEKGLMRLFCLTIFTVIVALFIPNEISAQISNPGNDPLANETFKSAEGKKQSAGRELPPSRVNEFIKPDAGKTIRLPKLGEAEKSAAASTIKKMRIGTVRQLDQKVSDFSQAAEYAVGDGKVWVFEVVSEAAIQTRLRFNNMNLPAGAKVFVYSAKNPMEVYGPFEKTGESKDGIFWTPPIEGDDVIVEYYAPNQTGSAKNNLPFEIIEVSHIFRDISEKQDAEMISPPEFPCHNNVPPEWANVAKSVGQMQFTSGGFEYICTGTLLNPTANDYDPIFLTANHCISTEAEAQSLRVYWLYNSGDFPSVSLPRSDSASLLSTGERSDYTLLRIRGAIPLRAGVTYSGWEAAATTLIGTAVAGIHHPRGSYKRFSTGTTNTSGDFIEVRWNSGITEGGSSGSGIWKGGADNARLIGTLSNGTVGCTNPRDFYGNFTITYQSISTFLQGGSDDNYDAAGGNDTRQTAAAIGQGTFSNLIVKWQDADWYAVIVPRGYKITATANFNNNFGNVDLALYKNSDGAPVSVSSSTSNSETVTDTATAATTYYINAFLFDGARNEYALNVSLQQVVVDSRPALFDYDGDRRADVSVFRPSNNVWYLSGSTLGFSAVSFGSPGDVPAPADYDGDGKTDVGVFRPSNGSWYWINSSNNSLSAVGFGAGGDIPAPADYDGDGKADVNVFRPSNGTWYRLNSGNNSFTATQFGGNGDIPTAGDFDGDGKADIGVWRPSNGVWYRLNSAANNAFYAVQFGGTGDKPVPADFDGDGKTDVAVFRPSNGVWYRLNSSDSQFIGVGFGAAEDKPAPADYDGDGKADIAVFRSSNATWYLQMSQSGFTARQFGAGEDMPTPGAFIR